MKKEIIDTKKSNSSYENVLKEAASKKRNYMSFSKTFPAFIVLIIMLIITFVIFDSLKQSTAINKNAQFDKAVSSVMTRFDNQTDKIVGVTKSVSGAYDLMIEVVRDYFELLAEIPVMTHSSILSIDYIPRVENDNLGNFIFLAMNEAYYDYHLFPKGDREVYFPIEHIVPLKKNKHKQGFDVNTVPEISKILQNSIDSNIMVATVNYDVRPDTLGFYILTPVYKFESELNSIDTHREFILGFVAIELNSKLFFDNALKGGKKSKVAFAGDTTIIYKVLDEGNIVYQSNNGDLLTSEYTTYLHRTKQIIIANREITVEFYTIPEFGGKLQNSFSSIILLISLVLSLAFFGFVLSVITARARALDLAERMTRSQRRIVDTSQDIIGVFDYQGNWKTINPASLKIFGYLSSDMIGKPFVALFENDKQKEKYEKIVHKIHQSEKEIERIDIKMKNIDEELVWMNWSLTFSDEDGLIYAIGRDVTVEKLQEIEAKIKANQIELAGQLTREVSESKTYFMIKLSQHLRNSLTSISGYIQLLKDELYDSPEEMNEYLVDAYANAEELFKYIEGYVDTTIQSDKEKNLHIEIINVKENIEKIKQEINTEENIVNIQYDEDNDVRLMADTNLFKETIYKLVEIFQTQKDNIEINIHAVVNTFEGAAEMQILGSPNAFVSEMIQIYKNPDDSVLQSLKYDKENIILNFAICASNIRRMQGSMVVETFGPDEENLVQITLPINQSN